MASQEHSAIELAGLRFQIGVHEQVLRTRPEDGESLRFLANAYGLVGRLDDRLHADRQLTRLNPRDPRTFYNLACSYAILDRAEDALQALGKAVSLGFRDLVLLNKDQELDALRDNPKFIQIAALVEDLENK